MISPLSVGSRDDAAPALLVKLSKQTFCTALSSIGLCKMFSRWILGIFNIQIQSDRGHKLMLVMFQDKDKDLLGIYQYGCDPFCLSLLTDRHLKVRSNHARLV